jgi:hypothetical protein
MLGGDTVVEKTDLAKTYSKHDDASGKKTIYLGQDALQDGSQFGLNVYFVHEAYRNGIDDGVIGQRTETDKAVLGHIEAALGLLGSYGAGAVGEAAAAEALKYMDSILLLQNGSGTDKAKAMKELYEILGKYDSSDDNWLLRNDGTLEYDGNGYLNLPNGKTVRDQNGKKIGSAAIEAGLIAIMRKAGITLTPEQAAQLLADAGFEHTNEESTDTGTWFWNVMNGEGTGQANMGRGLTVAALLDNGNEQFAETLTAATAGLYARFLDWETGWNNATDAARGMFYMGQNVTYEELYPFYNANDEVWNAGGPVAWAVQNITRHTIGGVRVLTHKDNIPILETLAATLNADELTDLFSGYRGGFVARFTTSSAEHLSDHSFGRALDFFDGENPFISNRDEGAIAFNILAAAANGTVNSLADYSVFMEANKRFNAVRKMDVGNFLKDYNDRKVFLAGYEPGPVYGFADWEQVYSYVREYEGLYNILNDVYGDVNNDEERSQNIDARQRTISAYNNWLDKGIVNLPPRYIKALTDSGFDWGALWARSNIIDGMHFYQNGE